MFAAYRYYRKKYNQAKKKLFRGHPNHKSIKIPTSSSNRPRMRTEEIKDLKPIQRQSLPETDFKLSASVTMTPQTPAPAEGHGIKNQRIRRSDKNTVPPRKTFESNSMELQDLPPEENARAYAPINETLTTRPHCSRHCDNNICGENGVALLNSQSENTRLNSHISILEGEINTLQSIHEKFKRDIEIRSRRVLELESDLKKVQANEKSLKADIESLKIEVSYERTRADRADRAGAQIRQACEELKQDKQSLQLDLRDCIAEVKRLRTAKESAEKKVANLQSKLTSAEEEKDEIVANNHEMQMTILELTSRGGLPQQDENYFAKEFVSLRSLINQFSTRHFRTKQLFPLDYLHKPIPNTSVLYQEIDASRTFYDFFEITARDPKGPFQDAKALSSRARHISAAFFAALETVHYNSYPFIGLPQYKAQIDGLLRCCGGTELQKHNLLIRATNLISKSPALAEEQNIALEKAAGDLESFLAPLASPESDSQNRYANILKVVQKFAELIREVGQHDSPLYFSKETDPTMGTHLGILYDPNRMKCLDTVETEEELVARNALVQTLVYPALYKRSFNPTGGFTKKPSPVLKMEVLCVPKPKEPKRVTRLEDDDYVEVERDESHHRWPGGLPIF